MRAPVKPRRYSPLRGRRLTAYEQWVERATSTRAGAWTFLHVFSAIDRRLLPLTRGRVTVAAGAPVGILETTGARSGRRRRVPMLYHLDGDAVVVVASNGGSAHDPAWLRNVRAKPEVRFLSREHGWRSYRARIAAGDERARRWALVTDLYAGYDAYQARAAPRRIAVVVAEPLSSGS